jgi:hypothetical protein
MMRLPNDSGERGELILFDRSPSIKEAENEEDEKIKFGVIKEERSMDCKT